MGSTNYYLVILGYGLVDIDNIEDYNINTNQNMLIFSGYTLRGDFLENKIISPFDVICLILKAETITSRFLSMYLAQYLTGADMELALDLASDL